MDEGRADGRVHEQSDQAVVVLFRLVEKGSQAHSEEEDEDIAEEDGQRMPHEEILQPGRGGRLEKLALRHDRK